MPLDRRDVLLGAGMLAAAGALPGLVAAAGTAAAADGAAEAVLADTAEELLALYPESASTLGIDTNARATLKSRLTDRSPEGVRHAADLAAARRRKLAALKHAGLSAATQTDLAVTETAYRLAAEGSRFPYGDVAILNHEVSYRNGPYVVTQNMGAFTEVPEFLDTQHRIAGLADAEAYLERLQAYARALDGETARLRHDSAAGVSAPAFILDKTIRQLSTGRAVPLAEWGIVSGLAKRTAGFPKDFGAQALKIATDEIAPALERQIEELERQRPVASTDAGVWQLPEGDAYYAWALRAGTTTDLDPARVHQMGLEQLAALQARMDPLLRAQGLTQGTAGERMTALGKDPRVLFANTDAGREEILAYVNGRLADIRTRLPRAFATLGPGNLLVKRVPPAIENGAPDGYAGPGTMDGSQPGLYYINLRDTSIWPRYALPTLSYHEGIPGHVWQGEYTYKLPLVRSLLEFNAYSEGWALYAEQLADELGVYDGDPLGKLGYLQSLAFRACRLVVDTGIHAKRWSRAKAIEWFATTNGSSVLEVTAEVDRYCVWPGQACGYKVGHTEINRLREHAQKALGAGYDLRLFDDAVVKGGNVPMTLLPHVIDRYLAAQRRGKAA
ncbi:MAG: DUF885 family protein [Proteobacteria bacterium]|nr:DUF885 family protein [Pseudomonadota bacterium]